MIALGYVHRELAEKGRQIVVGNANVTATVTGFGW
jgi:hypothetical protein